MKSRAWRMKNLPPLELTADGYPIAYSSLQRGYQGPMWVIEACPLCGGRHCHGAGPELVDGLPAGGTSSKTAHCSDKIGIGANYSGYVLRIADPKAPAIDYIPDRLIGRKRKP